MNIDINLIPEELRIKPLVDGKTFAAIAVVVLLAFGSFYFFYAKNDSQNSITNMENQIRAAQQQTAALSSNAEALQLTNSIQQLETMRNSYSAFATTKILLGDSLVRVYALVPSGVNIGTIAQTGNTLVIKGTAYSYTELSDYARALDNDSQFTVTGLPSLNKGAFTLNIRVASGGAR